MSSRALVEALTIYIMLEIEKAFVNDTPVDFEYVDAVSELSLGANTTIAHHQVYKSRYLNALRDADEGELSIKLPADCIKQVVYTL
jgi:transcription initiation factor TFIID subunit 2